MIVDRTDRFIKSFSKIRDLATKERVCGQVKKIISMPDIGKPLRYTRKGTRELYVSPFRIAYAYLKEENKIVFLDVYHKDEQ